MVHIASLAATCGFTVRESKQAYDAFHRMSPADFSREMSRLMAITNATATGSKRPEQIKLKYQNLIPDFYYNQAMKKQNKTSIWIWFIKLFLPYPLGIWIARLLKKPWRTFIVPAGEHSCKELINKQLYPVSPEPWLKNKMEFLVKVNNSWFYEKTEKLGWNKIFGFSNGHHHFQGSARVVMQPFMEGVNIGGYCYANGVSPQQDKSLKSVIQYITKKKILHCKISQVKTGDEWKWKVRVDNNEQVYNAGNEYGIGYILFPYIGGDFIVEHDVKFEILLL